MMRSVWVFVLVVLAILASYWWRSMRRAQDASTPSFDMQMVSVAASAVQLAKQQFGVTLDYTPKSIGEVERILASKHEQQLKQPESEENLSAASIVWGAYIGETAKRSRGGHWERDSLQIGRNAMPLVLADGTVLFPCAWVYKRLTNGEEDNVQYKFHVLMDQQK